MPINKLIISKCCRADAEYEYQHIVENTCFCDVWVCEECGKICDVIIWEDMKCVKE